MGMDFPATFDNYALYFYGEYGLFTRFTLITSMPFFKQSISEANFLRGETNGYLAGDLELQSKYQFLDRPVVASALIGLKLPVGYEVYDLPPLGNDETDFDTKMLLGVSLYPIPAYITGDVGYRFRGGDFVDEWNYTLEAGYTLRNKFLFRFLTTSIKSTHEAEGESTLLGFPLAQEQVRFGGGVIFIWNQRIELDVTYLKTTSGKNIPSFGEFFFGIAFKK
ncbi:MAG: hypothetical protein Kow0042_17970 [Calditrichia bacterium]